MSGEFRVGPFRGIDPAAIAPAEAYSLLTGCVLPRPIAFVSSLSGAGIANLAPFSFFNAGGAHPPSVVFMPVTGGTNRDKDTLNNVRETGEYVIHIVPWALRERMNLASADYPPEVDELVDHYRPLPSELRLVSGRLPLTATTRPEVDAGWATRIGEGSSTETARASR